jgi:tRNA (guanine10-N2)-methyltransferase
MDDIYLIRFTQTHESFRHPELEALSTHANLPHEIVSYDENSPFCLLRFPTLIAQRGEENCVKSRTEHSRAAVDARIKAFESRSILSKCIYEVLGQGRDYDELHKDVKRRSQQLWDTFRQKSFKFSIDCYGSTRDVDQQMQIINSFRYLDLKGKIKMKDPEVEFAVLEEWLPLTIAGEGGARPEPAVDRIAGTSMRRVFLARRIGDSSRWLREKHDLKKRPYISTTSMDAELALLTACMALASPGKVFLDPFVGTGGFMVAAAELGALVLGSDIDGRSFRGKGLGLDKGVGANLQKYGLTDLFGDCFTSDLTNTPFRTSATTFDSRDGRWLDGIICDPPYGVREGLKVLGTKFRPSRSLAAEADGQALSQVKSNNPSSAILIDGVPAHTLPGFIAPKKPYSFTRMLDDILDFTAMTLVDGGRLAFWMPSANENEMGEEVATVIPTHRHLELKHECVQRFNKWSRRLLVYERLPGNSDVRRDWVESAVRAGAEADGVARTADELNPFRRRYFQSFVADRNSC